MVISRSVRFASTLVRNTSSIRLIAHLPWRKQQKTTVPPSSFLLPSTPFHMLLFRVLSEWYISSWFRQGDHRMTDRCCRNTNHHVSQCSSYWHWSYAKMVDNTKILFMDVRTFDYKGMNDNHCTHIIANVNNVPIPKQTGSVFSIYGWKHF